MFYKSKSTITFKKGRSYWKKMFLTELAQLMPVSDTDQQSGATSLLGPCVFGLRHRSVWWIRAGRCAPDLAQSLFAIWGWTSISTSICHYGCSHQWVSQDPRWILPHQRLDCSREGNRHPGEPPSPSWYQSSGRLPDMWWSIAKLCHDRRARCQSWHH